MHPDGAVVLDPDRFTHRALLTGGADALAGGSELPA
jgi:hypothetical protein